MAYSHYLPGLLRRGLVLFVASFLGTSAFAAIRVGEANAPKAGKSAPMFDPTPGATQGPVEPEPASASAWSFLGGWSLKHPLRKGAITAREDGSFIGAEGEAGRWNLFSDKGRMLLALTWKDGATELAEMIDGDHFSGKIQEGSVELRRIGIAAASAPDEAGAVQITSAMYGKGDQRVDVTRELRNLLKDGRLRIEAPWNFGSLDPKATESEDLIVQYRIGDRNRTARFRKNEPIVLPKE